MKHLILGGARSGKSRFAEQEVMKAKQESSRLVYIATATAGDAEMASRIQHHQSNRDKSWQLVEEPLHLAAALSPYGSNDCVLIDCLTLWLSNCLHEAQWPEHKQAFLETIEQSPATIFLVSNEVGQGIVPLGELSRQFVDESGYLHQKLAGLCDRVTLITAGLPMILKNNGKK